MSLLLSVLKGVIRRADPGQDDLLPVMRQEVVRKAHESAPLEEHLEIAFAGLQVGNEPIARLVRRCLRDTGAVLPPLKALHRPLASYFLVSYYLQAMRLGGARAECGVFQGTSALLLCRAAKTADHRHTGEGLHLIDSFAGLSEPGESDRLPVPGTDGSRRSSLGAGAGALAGSLDVARGALAEFPAVTFHVGWIPEVLARLPVMQWSFVHLDVDLFQPTHDALAYFYPRLLPGGVILCDDYGSALFPGAYRAWQSYCEEHKIPYVVLDTGQSVILKR